VPFDAILFDFDGVLVDSEPIHYDCWMEVLGPFGLRVDWDTYVRTCIGISDRTMLERFAKENPTPLDVEKLLAQYPRKKELFRERMIAANPFPAATLELIPELAHAQGVPMAVVSSSGRTEVEPAMIHAGIRQHFQTLVCGLEAGKLKPEPDPYLKAAETLGARRPLVVEDSDAGVAAGHAAGFEVLRIAHPNELARELRRYLAVLKLF
jgi:beta-phosphoglucomutase